jgi:NAD-dependent deacetylase
MRPDIVLFEEALPVEALAELDRQLRQPFDLCVSVGTSSVFPYIVAPVIRANRLGLPTIEINPTEKTTISNLVDIHCQLGAADAFEQIAKCLGIDN